MSPERFCYWLQGKFEDRNTQSSQLSQVEIVSIKAHLALVFTKVTPTSLAEIVEKQETIFDSSQLETIIETINKEANKNKVVGPFNQNPVYC